MCTNVAEIILEPLLYNLYSKSPVRFLFLADMTIVCFLKNDKFRGNFM